MTCVHANYLRLCCQRSLDGIEQMILIFHRKESETLYDHFSLESDATGGEGGVQLSQFSSFSQYFDITSKISTAP